MVKLTGESLEVKYLLDCGFKLLGRWIKDGKGIRLEPKATTEGAVYVFAVNGIVHYIGVALNLKQRFYGYEKPGPSQKTNERVKKLIHDLLDKGIAVEVLFANLGEASWNGLPVNQNVGLESGLIKRFKPPWNVMGTSMRQVTVEDLGL